MMKRFNLIPSSRISKLDDIFHQLFAIFNDEVPKKVTIAKVNCATELDLCSGK